MRGILKQLQEIQLSLFDKGRSLTVSITEDIIVARVTSSDEMPTFWFSEYDARTTPEAELEKLKTVLSL